ncbi:MAG: hypothetical protein Q9228_002278 [Teloschistes exilis]
MLARDSFKVREIWWTMVNVFFGQPRERRPTKQQELIQGSQHHHRYSVFVLEVSELAMGPEADMLSTRRRHPHPGA